MRDASILTNNGVNVTKALELFGAMDRYDKTVEVFYDSIEEKLAKLKNFKETSNMAEYAILVHGLKSEANYFGFEKFAEEAYKHELGSKANNMYFVYDNFDELISEIRRIVKVVGQYLGREEKEASVVNAQPVAKERALLVVDDSDIITHFVKQVFDADFEVISAADGAQAIAVIEQNANKNIIGMLLDLNMPNVNGFTVLDYLKANDLFKKLPVCIVTGIDTKEMDEKAFTYPIMDMIKKPFNERDIKTKVEKFIIYRSNQDGV